MTTSRFSAALAPLLEAWSQQERTPWQSPFIRTGGYGLPRNASTAHIYQASNAMLLLLWSAMTGHRPVMLTWCQKQDLAKRKKIDLKLKKGSQGVWLLRPFTATVKDSDPPRTATFVKQFKAWSVDQLTDPEIVMGDPRLLVQREPRLAGQYIERLISLGNIQVDTVEAKAHYSPTYDRVRLPDVKTVTTEDEWVATAFHELVHWTGHTSRLDRIKLDHWNGDAYAREELVAEVGAALLCSHFGINHVSNAMSYIKTWAARIAESEQAFFHACADAQRAVSLLDHIAGVSALESIEAHCS